MATYIGYNTINQIKKHRLTDTELVKRDFLNNLNIRQGEIPGRPEVGTDIWNYVFDPNTQDTQRKIRNELQRLIDSEPRMTLEDINLSAKGHLVLIEMGVRISPNVDQETIEILFDERNSLARLLDRQS